jgi:tetratricopeptide (TPR) repeat protein
LKPDHHVAWHNLGAALQTQHQLAEAVVAFRNAVELKPDYATGCMNLANALKENGELLEAVEAYRKAIRARPNYERAWFNLGIAFQALSKFAEAKEAYGKALALRPTNAATHNNLAWLLATCLDPKFRDPDEAVRLAKRAVELDRERGDFWGTLGTAHYRSGEWQAGIVALTKSAQLRKGGDAFDWFFLAMAHWQLGHKDEPLQWYEKAVAWMDKNRAQDPELIRFRTEAASLLGLQNQLAPRNK